MLYELTAQAQLFTGANDFAIFEAIVRTPLPSFDPSYPPALATIVRRALANEPADRFATALEMRDAILAVLDERDFRCELAAIVSRIFAPTASSSGSNA